jgi:hypothetical protein
MGALAGAMAFTSGVTAGCGAAPIDAVTLDSRGLARDIVAHWPFDDVTGTAVVDRSGNHHDGQLIGGAWVPRGRFGGALRLGFGDNITVPTFPQATPSWTVSVWLQVTAADLAADAADLSTLLSAEQVFAGGWQVHLDNRPGFGTLDVAYWAGPPVEDYVVLSCKCIVVDQWIHLTATFDSVAHTATLYRDTTVAAAAIMPADILPGDSTLYIGRWNQNARYLAGTIDDFAIWSRALTADEVATLAIQPPPSPP